MINVRVGAVLIGAALIALAALGAGQYRRHQSIARAAAVSQQYFPLELKDPLVYKVTKHLSRRILSEKRPSMEQLEDAYYTRLSLEPGTGSPSNAKALRSDKCNTLRVAINSTANTKEEALVDSPEGIRLAATRLLLLPPITTVKPVTFSLTFGNTREGDGYFGWPLLEVVGLAELENKLFQEIEASAPDGSQVFRTPKVERQVLFNVMREETVRFFQSEGEEITLGGATFKTVKLEYSGQLTKNHYYHQIGGAVWLAPKLGVIKEQRQVVFKIYPPEELDPETNLFVKKTRDVLLYEARVVKLLAHPI